MRRQCITKTEHKISTWDLSIISTVLRWECHKGQGSRTWQISCHFVVVYSKEGVYLLIYHDRRTQNIWITFIRPNLGTTWITAIRQETFDIEHRHSEKQNFEDHRLWVKELLGKCNTIKEHVSGKWSILLSGRNLRKHVSSFSFFIMI